MAIKDIMENFPMLNEEEKYEILNAGFDENKVENFDIIDHFIYKAKQNVVMKIIDNGFDINTQNHYGWSFLHMAIRHDKIQIVEYLLEKGININIVDSVGWTSLMEAIMDDKPKIVQLLVDKKADQTLANKRGATAKMLIMKFSRQSMMGMLN
jgi:ankyrin repeat protein